MVRPPADSYETRATNGRQRDKGNAHPHHGTSVSANNGALANQLLREMHQPPEQVVSAEDPCYYLHCVLIDQP